MLDNYLESRAHADVIRWRVRWSVRPNTLDFDIGEPIDYWIALAGLFVHESGATCLDVGEP